MDATTLVFAVLAIFVIWKLRSVLGTRTGHEQRPVDLYRQRTGDGASDEASRTVVRFPSPAANPLPEQEMQDRRSSWSRLPGVSDKVLPGLEAIAAAERDFEPKSFVEGAKAAYEMIVMSFAAGNRGVLKDLLSNEVFESFSAAISDRESRGETVDTTFVSIDQAIIEDAQLRGPTAQITMRLQSKLITSTRDRDGSVISGNADKVVDMVDVWTFARDVNSRNPNWLLVATEAGG